MDNTTNHKEARLGRLGDWLGSTALPDARASQRLIGFAVAVLAARAALANSTLSRTEFRHVGDAVKEFSTLSDEESSAAAYFAIQSGRSGELVDVCIEILTLELDEQGFLQLLKRLTRIMALDHKLCEGDIEYLYELYLRVCEAIGACVLRSQPEKDRYCQSILRFIREEIAIISSKPAAVQSAGFVPHVFKGPRNTGSSFEIQSPSGRVVYRAQLIRE